MPIFQDLFERNAGLPILYGGKEIHSVDRIIVPTGEPIVVTFEHIGSRFRQAVCLDLDGTFLVDGQSIRKKMILWHNTAPRVVTIMPTVRKRAKDGRILVFNAWDRGNGVTDAWTMGGAMIVEDTPTGRRYRCNDWEPDDDFDDLIFTIDFKPAAG